MPTFPFFGYPYPYYYKNRRQNYYSENVQETHSNKVNNISNENLETLNEKDEEKENKTNSSRYNAFGPIYFQDPFSIDSNEPILEILGIKLYLDDILILGLLFFLYNEGVKDQMLFFVLILLLLT